MYVVVVGGIGTGKSFLVSQLAAHYSTVALLDNVYDNPYFSLFYQRPQEYAFHFQLYALLNKIKKINAIAKKTSIIQEKSIEEDVFIYSSYLNAVNIITELDFQLYQQYFIDLKHLLPQPDLMIYLRADFQNLYDAYKKRKLLFFDRSMEAYFQNIHYRYEYFFRFLCDPSKLLIVDIYAYDFKELKDFTQLIQMIDAKLSGLQPKLAVSNDLIERAYSIL